MNLLDIVLLVGVVMAALGGWRAGFLARVTSWLGLALGFYVGLRILPSVLEAFELPTVSARLLVVITVLVVSIFVGQALGLIVGHRLRTGLPVGGARVADRGVGAAAGAISVLVALWLLLPTIADVQGWPSRQARTSLIARGVSNALPEPPDTTKAVRRLVDERTFPRVFDALRPAPDSGLPPVTLTLSPEVVAKVIASTVKVQGEACRRIQEGSGFVVSENVIVTNAHVVAGEERVEVVRPDGKRLQAQVVVFDPAKDLSVLRVENLGLPSLGRANAEVGMEGAVFGHPGGQAEVRAAPARISEEVTASGEDIYGASTIRQVYILAASLQPGDSGGALVDQEGRVVGVAFAIAPDRASTAYALTGAELDKTIQAYNANPDARATTQDCLA
ncbi:MAG TPA: MarP family serine protease [Acidimicrobiales bacterium]|jgi:S1-C subfamily serine protease|nr:MarP family serine protease [Acidimicrobiales bacterium]